MLVAFVTESFALNAKVAIQVIQKSSCQTGTCVSAACPLVFLCTVK